MQNQRINGRLQSPSVHVWADVSPLPVFKVETEAGAGARARVGAVHVSDEWLDCVPISVALASRAMPAGPLLLECQGQQVLAMARRQAGKLQASTAKDGRAMSDTSVSEAVGAGAAAAVAWRNGQELDGGQYGAAGVCWRAVVASVSEDVLGESIEEWRGEEGGAECWDSLTGSMLPLPQLVGDDSRPDRASRLLFERARAKRGDLLARRVESLKLRGGRGKRCELIDKLHRAAVQLLHGVSVDEAAQAAGFKSNSKASAVGGATRAGDRLMQAARRLGLRVQFNLRQVEPREREGGAGAFVPLSPDYVQALCGRPSAVLPLQDGRGGKRWVAKLRRVARANRRQRLLAAGRARVAERMARRAARASRRANQQAARARSARRAFKGQGWAVGSGVPDWFSIVHHSRAVYWGE